jgi:uncharacterized protein (DUF4415 family)
MNVNKPSMPTNWVDPDDAPDLSTSQWRNHIQRTGVLSVGRPKSANPKVHQTLRLDPDIVAHFKSGGAGWQTRMNDALRKAAGLPSEG